jgi:serine/threonine-protein kinase
MPTPPRPPAPAPPDADVHLTPAADGSLRPADVSIESNVTLGPVVELTDTPRLPVPPPRPKPGRPDGLRPGEEVPGYEVLAPLGSGAMGVVYKARQVNLDRLVALKMMIGYGRATDPERQRFHAEATTVARVQHPNVIQVYDVGDHDGTPYLAVEYVDGGTLAERLATGGKLPIGVAVRLMLQVARGVGAAHSRGIVHRDLKPANILLTADGVPKVADFGLAKLLGAESNTVSGSILGSPAYMAPEQAAGQVRRTAPQTDVFALGVILYECLSGVTPFHGETVMQTLDRVRTVEPLELHVRRADVPPALERIVHRCLHKAPAERYPTADALAEDLARLLIARPQDPRPGGLNIFHLLTAVAGLGVIALIAWLANQDWATDGRTPPPTPAAAVTLPTFTRTDPP